MEFPRHRTPDLPCRRPPSVGRQGGAVPAGVPTVGQVLPPGYGGRERRPAESSWTRPRTPPLTEHCRNVTPLIVRTQKCPGLQGREPNVVVPRRFYHQRAHSAYSPLWREAGLWQRPCPPTSHLICQLHGSTAPDWLVRNHIPRFWVRDPGAAQSTRRQTAPLRRGPC